MEASIDGYAQMRVLFSSKDLNNLESAKRLEGEIWRFSGETPPDRVRLLIYLREHGRMKAFSLPRGSYWEEKTAYVVRLIPVAISAMRERKFVGIGPMATLLRNVHMSLDDVF